LSKAYCVLNCPGNGHHFLKGLILQFVEPKKVYYNKITLNAHAYYLKYLELNTNVFQIRKVNPSEFPFLLTLNKNSNIPLVFSRNIWFYEKEFDFNRMELINPNIKYLNVLIEESDLIKLETNHFFKRTIFVDDITLPNIAQYFYFYGKIYNKPLKRLSDVSVSESENLIKIVVESGKEDLLKKYNDMLKTPEEFQNRIYTINFNDIYHNKDFVLDVLSEMTELPIPEVVRQNYDLYIENQNILLDQKAPWLRPLY